MQAHTHSIPQLNGITSTDAGHVHGINGWLLLGIRYDTKYGTLMSGYGFSTRQGTDLWYNSNKGALSEMEKGGTHSHTVTTYASTTESNGSGNSQNLQPYIVTYIWKRTE